MFDVTDNPPTSETPGKIPVMTDFVMETVIATLNAMKLMLGGEEWRR